MPQATASAAEINRQFVERMMICAADIVFYDQPFGHPDAVDALLRAKTELLAEEPADQKVRRTYGGAEIIPDFGQYVASQHPEFIPPEGFGTIITPWCCSQTSRTVAETLRAGSQTIGAAVARRTAIAEQRKCFNDRELEQLETLDQLSDFLSDQGIAADIQGRKPYDAYPAEFHGQINGTRWSLAVAQLTHAGARFNADIEQPSNRATRCNRRSILPRSRRGGTGFAPAPPAPGAAWSSTTGSSLLHSHGKAYVSPCLRTTPSLSCTITMLLPHRSGRYNLPTASAPLCPTGPYGTSTKRFNVG